VSKRHNHIDSTAIHSKLLQLLTKFHGRSGWSKFAQFCYNKFSAARQSLDTPLI
jgi:hypothetical protein